MNWWVKYILMPSPLMAIFIFFLPRPNVPLSAWLWWVDYLLFIALIYVLCLIGVVIAELGERLEKEVK